jgi:hypothetical protein
MWKHGLYGKLDKAESLDEMIDMLFRRQYQADEIFDRIVDPHDLLRLLRLHFRNAHDIGDLLLKQKALEDDGDDLLSALGPALDLIEKELQKR